MTVSAKKIVELVAVLTDAEAVDLVEAWAQLRAAEAVQDAWNDFADQLDTKKGTANGIRPN